MAYCLPDSICLAMDRLGWRKKIKPVNGMYGVFVGHWFSRRQTRGSDGCYTRCCSINLNPFLGGRFSQST